MEQLYEKYINIQKFIVNYRKYTIDEKFLDYQTFKKTIQIDQYIKHKCVNVSKGRLVFIYLFRGNSKYVKTTPQFKRLMDKTSDEPADIIIISKNELSVYINKALMKYPHLKVFNYLHKYFAIELANGPLCSPHTVLSNNEVRNLCSRELIIHPLSLPSISISDPQNIWIGGELGQVIKIVSISEITGKAIRYRIVSPESGKLINLQKLNKKINQADADAKKENEKTTIDNESEPSEVMQEYLEEDGSDFEEDN